MPNNKTIKIPAEDWNRHNERRQEMGLTWNEYIDGEAPEYIEEEAHQRELVYEAARRAVEDVARS